MQTAFAEAELVKWASAIEDLQKSTDAPSKRQRPTWRGYLERNVPVPF
jgi:amidase